MGNMQQLLSSLPVFFIIIIISVVFYSLPPVSARSQSTQLQIHPDYDYDFQNSGLIHNEMTNSAYLKENKKASNIIGARLIKKFDLTNGKLVSSKDLNSTVSKVSARSQSSPQFLSFDRETYGNLDASLPRSLLFDLTFEKFENSARSQSYPPFSLDRVTYLKLFASSLPQSSLFDRTLEKSKNSTRLQSSAWTSLLADLETHQNSAQAEPSPSFRSAPETNQKHLNCDCYQISAQPRLSSSFSASLETLQKQLNYEFQNVVLLRQAMTHSSYSLENNKEFSILGERLIETTVSLRLSTKDLEISLKDLNDKMSEVLEVDTSCAADGTRLGLQNIVRVSSSTDSSTSSIVCDAFRAIIWAIALDSRKCDDAHNVFWAVHCGDGKAI